LIKLQFDFNPLHLQRMHSQAVSTFLQFSSDPAMDANSEQVLAPLQSAAIFSASVGSA
jgi:hypothetical protein